jgi:hypothetical protein
MTKALKGITCEERCKEVGMSTLEERKKLEDVTGVQNTERNRQGRSGQNLCKKAGKPPHKTVSKPLEFDPGNKQEQSQDFIAMDLGW